MRLATTLLATILALCAAPALAQSLEQMAGQMIIVGFAGDSVDDKGVAAVRKQVSDGTIGGVMYLKTNVASRSAVAAMNDAFRKAAPADLPPFITLDQEGGLVERLGSAVGFKEIPDAETIAAEYTAEQSRSIYEQLARGVRDWGFNVNFAPVVDLAVNPNNQVIAKYGRAYGKTADVVSEYVAQVVAAHHDAGLLTSLKHFPGHGSSTADSHEGFVDITRTWKPTELDPYRALIAKGYDDFVMVGHLIDTEIDPTGLPSSLSPVWIGSVLRGQLGFAGVVITDDLEMGAIRDHYGLEETVKRAVRAGVDVLLFSNTAKPRASLGAEVRKILVDTAESDPEFKARIEESYKRIVALKARIRN
ncbi:glycoside hydrolase family 3 N-terminal domain-containing protein [Devosia sp.]|uniref:glycoside hydrolase family 3 N-terminal domain-containing protein n=1 Tax=Devosia sp. TaxID=1871048 RepID=UPI001AD149E8|nr:glycoside hydrolase family 3 N-terminal domain-containing protein [Devosia sp.]MBN9309401.1 glycoside hydrolase family 3 protein [Devosia sp.]